MYTKSYSFSYTEPDEKVKNQKVIALDKQDTKLEKNERAQAATKKFSSLKLFYIFLLLKKQQKQQQKFSFYVD